MYTNLQLVVSRHTLRFFGRLHSTIDRFLASHPVAPGSILGIPKIFSLDVAEIY